MWKCSKCTESVEDAFGSCWNCGTHKNGNPPDNPVEFYAARAEAREAITGRGPQTGPAGIVLAIIGILLIVFGTIQLTSVDSQRQRVAGHTDVLAALFFFAGAIVLLIGFSRGLASSPSTSDSPPPGGNSVEARLRQLDDLRAKELVSDAEHKQRRHEIIASL